MTTPANEALTDALHRADTGRLAELLDARDCPPATLGLVLRHEDGQVGQFGLALLTERLAGDHPADPQELSGLAALLPDSPTGPPEAALLLAGLHRRLAPWLRGRPRPQWRTADLPAPVRIAWLATELLADPTALRREPRGELLQQAVRELDVAAALRPELLVAELAAGEDGALHAAALRLARRGLHAGLLAPAVVRGLLTGLLGSGDGATAAGALAALAEPWAAPARLPAALIAPFLTLGAPQAAAGAPDPAEAALAAAARHGHADLLRRAAEDEALPPGLRRSALELLGGLAERTDIAALTALAARDPLLLGGPAVSCLLGLHRRGHFPAASDVPAVLGLALADHGVPAREVATVLYTCRRVVFQRLLDAPADDPSWPRRLDLLVALAGQGAAELPVGEAVARLLPTAPDPVPFLRAIRALRDPGAESAVLDALPAAPTAALDALAAVGGPRTAAALRAGLGLTGEGNAGVIAPPLRAVRHQALELLWHLTEDAAGRGDLLDRLNPLDLPTRIAADLGGPDERELALLRSHLDFGDPAAALCRLAAHGDAATLPAVGALLLRVVAELAAAREPEADAGPALPGGGRPAGEPAVPEEVLDAVRALGARLYARRRIRPVCLLDAPDATAAGHALVASLALDLLDRPGLPDAEQAVLLELLLRAPSPDTRPRVHRLLRHRDRHVRKHVIALLARGAGGEDARALSATLITLTTAADVQTVRQALLALGHARAHWAGEAVAACLDHPAMNVRKTAAEALARTGTPATVPALLRHLGRSDNPGLRGLLDRALRAVLGEAHPATLLAAAEQSGEVRSCELLLAALDGELTARAVRALDEQGSPVVPALLGLVAAGRVGLAAGTVAELAPALERHGVDLPGGPPPGTRADAAVRSLATAGWDAAVAVRLATAPEAPDPADAARLRPLLADWLRLAESRAALRAPVLRLALRICPSPWTDGELAHFAGTATILLDGLADAAGEDRARLLAVLDALAPRLSPVQAQAVVRAVRALPPTASDGPADGPATTALLRRCGAVLVRADVERALASARLGADPWAAEPAVLREAFGLPRPGLPAPLIPADGRPRPLPAPRGADTTAAQGWRSRLATAVRTPGGFARFRGSFEAVAAVRAAGVPGSRELLDALIEVYHPAGQEVRAALLDWMTALQPLGAPAWTLAENSRAEAPAPRAVRTGDLDQPRSAALRERLLTLLDSPAADRREAAALALLPWPEPATRLAVLRAYLRGRIEGPPGLAPAHGPDASTGFDTSTGLGALSEPELRAGGIRHERVALAALRLAPGDAAPLLPLLLEWWEQDPPAARQTLARALRHAPADVLAAQLESRLEAGAWGYLDLLAGRPLLRTPALTRIRQRLLTEGREDLAATLRLVDGPLHGADASREDALAAAPEVPAPARRPPPRPQSRQELLESARTGGAEQIRRSLTRLAELPGGPRGGRDEELRDLIAGLLRHPKAGVRLHAHRTSRAVFDRPTHLGHTATLLDDPQPDVVRMAIRTLCRAGWRPALPTVTGLLEHPHPVVRRAAADGLAEAGAPAVPSLRRAADRARPDRRWHYTEVLDRIAADSGPPG
ncbi:HEAT repeat domain-containing protein [Kitasatospora sp. NPDC057015]|uniref:HEAT repeat domain-containing protein n=1 Tax=Kitasatospora sp. NPDC057015 TaxID=3346001 RepID=UPI0036320E6C